MRQTDHKGGGDASSLQILVHQTSRASIDYYSGIHHKEAPENSYPSEWYCLLWTPDILKTSKRARSIIHFSKGRKKDLVEKTQLLLPVHTTICAFLQNGEISPAEVPACGCLCCQLPLLVPWNSWDPHLFSIWIRTSACGHSDRRNFCSWGYTPSIPGWGGWVSLVSLMFHLKTGPQNALFPDCSMLPPSMHQVSNHTKKRFGNWVASGLS